MVWSWEYAYATMETYMDGLRASLIMWKDEEGNIDVNSLGKAVKYY